jgi:prolyl-tRNA editing enzyme YbaK/EbsC (Cys-tRNA(Pro) deacylase)
LAREDLTHRLDEAGARFELLPHVRTESAVAEAEALSIAPADVAKTLVVTTPDGYVRAVLPASERIDLRKLRKIRGGGRKQVHLASEEQLARDYPEFDLGAVPPIGGARRDPVWSRAAWSSATRSCWRRGRTRSPCASRPAISCASPKLRSPTSAWTSCPA